MNPWIVIIATACSGLPSMVDVVTGTRNHATAYFDSVYQPPIAPAPAISVFRAKSREEAEALATGYRERRLDGAVVALESVRAWPGTGCSESAVVVSPDGKTYIVRPQPKTKKVLREVEEPDGTETIWTEQP